MQKYVYCCLLLQVGIQLFSLFHDHGETEPPLISSIYPKNHNLPPLHSIELAILGHQIRLRYRRDSICFIQFPFPDLVDK
ncbi:hypothetical protein U1Q18_002756, partial [Sarracenia purpurea var. burkii]